MGSVGRKYTTGALLKVPATEIVAPHLWLKKITGGSPQISQKEGKIITNLPFLFDLFRFIAAGVFSACVLNRQKCCVDPIVHAKINSKVKQWIWTIANGTRESNGCPKKKVRSK